MVNKWLHTRVESKLVLAMTSSFPTPDLLKRTPSQQWRIQALYKIIIMDYLISRTRFDVCHLDRILQRINMISGAPTKRRRRKHGSQAAKRGDNDKKILFSSMNGWTCFFNCNTDLLYTISIYMSAYMNAIIDRQCSSSTRLCNLLEVLKKRHLH